MKHKMSEIAYNTHTYSNTNDITN